MSDFFGKPWSQWVTDYSASHQHPMNKICHKLGIPMIVISLPLMVGGIVSLALFQLGLLLFVLGWVLQFIGHAYEKKAPEFFKDWRFLFVGVRWWWTQMKQPNK